MSFSLSPSHALIFGSLDSIDFSSASILKSLGRMCADGFLDLGCGMDRNW